MIKSILITAVSICCLLLASSMSEVSAGSYGDVYGRVLISRPDGVLMPAPAGLVIVKKDPTGREVTTTTTAEGGYRISNQPDANLSAVCTVTQSSSERLTYCSSVPSRSIGGALPVCTSDQLARYAPCNGCIANDCKVNKHTLTVKVSPDTQELYSESIERVDSLQILVYPHIVSGPHDLKLYIKTSPKCLKSTVNGVSTSPLQPYRVTCDSKVDIQTQVQSPVTRDDTVVFYNMLNPYPDQIGSPQPAILDQLDETISLGTPAYITTLGDYRQIRMLKRRLYTQSGSSVTYIHTPKVESLCKSIDEGTGRRIEDMRITSYSGGYPLIDQKLCSAYIRVCPRVDDIPPVTDLSIDINAGKASWSDAALKDFLARWNGTDRTPLYHLRIDEGADGLDPKICKDAAQVQSQSSGDLCVNNLAGDNISYPFGKTKKYRVWIHPNTSKACNLYGASTVAFHTPDTQKTNLTPKISCPGGANLNPKIKSESWSIDYTLSGKSYVGMEFAQGTSHDVDMGPGDSLQITRLALGGIEISLGSETPTKSYTAGDVTQAGIPIAINTKNPSICSIPTRILKLKPKLTCTAGLSDVSTQLSMRFTKEGRLIAPTRINDTYSITLEYGEKVNIQSLVSDTTPLDLPTSLKTEYSYSDAVSDLPYVVDVTTDDPAACKPTGLSCASVSAQNQPSTPDMYAIKCGLVAGASNYEYRFKSTSSKDSLYTPVLSGDIQGASKTTRLAPGTYIAQCRPCDNEKKNCSNWDSPGYICTTQIDVSDVSTPTPTITPIPTKTVNVSISPTSEPAPTTQKTLTPTITQQTPSPIPSVVSSGDLTYLQVHHVVSYAQQVEDVSGAALVVNYAVSIKNNSTVTMRNISIREPQPSNSRIMSLTSTQGLAINPAYTSNTIGTVLGIVDTLVAGGTVGYTVSVRYNQLSTDQAYCSRMQIGLSGQTKTDSACYGSDLIGSDPQQYAQVELEPTGSQGSHDAKLSDTGNSLYVALVIGIGLTLGAMALEEQRPHTRSRRTARR